MYDRHSNFMPVVCILFQVFFCFVLFLFLFLQCDELKSGQLRVTGSYIMHSGPR